MAGCSAAAVAAVKDPAVLSARLRSAANELAPVQVDGIVADAGWLMKAIGASGGGHVRVATAGERVGEGWYAQRRIAGRSMSALVLSDGRTSRLLGLCGHWRGPDVDPDGFVHSGLVTLPSVPDLDARVIDWGCRCATAFDLRGVWGFDFVLDDAGRPTVVEINPRPTASMELLEGAFSLFAAHVEPAASASTAGCRSAESRASMVCYARTAATVPAAVNWPGWVADRPAAGSFIAAGSPICTVVAAAATPELAVTLARDRRRRIDGLLAGADGIEKSY
jgi:predicted ATP-grasp superfamily ATP-dependent carboligase